MPKTINKRWALVDGDDIIASADTKGALIEETTEEQREKHDIVALPTSDRNLFV